jgi:photosystem II stability/assembly factor-like uncharacterized protein
MHVLATAAVAAFLGGMVGVPAHATSCGRQSGPWTTIDLPAMPQIGSATTYTSARERLVLDPTDPRVVLVSAGRSVLRSVDGGCTWKTAIDLQADGPPGALFHGDVGYQVVQLVATPQHWMYAVMVDKTSTFSWPLPVYVALSKDGGQTWDFPSASSDPATVASTPMCIDAWLSVTRPASTAYLNCLTANLGTALTLGLLLQPQILYRTTDGATTWARAAGAGYDTAKPLIARRPLVIDPLDARRLWTATDSSSAGRATVLTTVDGGETWKPLPTPPIGVSHFWGGSAIHVAGQPARVMMWFPGGLLESTDDGASWQFVKPLNPLGQEGVLEGVAYERDASLLSVASYNGHETTVIEPEQRSCQQRVRLARRGSRTRWQPLGDPAIVPAAPVVWLSSLAQAQGVYGMLATSFNSTDDCTNGVAPKNYLLLFTG